MSAGDLAPTDLPPARRWYRRLMRLGPRALRAAHGTEMEELFLDALARRERAGPHGNGARLVCSPAWDLLRASFARPFKRRPANRPAIRERRELMLGSI